MTPIAAILRAPATQAAALQFAAFLCTVLAVQAGPWLSLQFTILTGALLQGVLAALLTRWRALAWWWLPIQLLFPLALAATLALRLPPAAFLMVFLFLLVLYWSTFRTQVPYYPSGRAVWDEVAALLPAGRPARVIDIGSGLGGFVCDLAARRPDCRFTGIELAPLPWLLSWLRVLGRKRNARFILGDYNRLDFAAFDVVFAYLSPAAMPALWDKAAREMRPGALLLSYEFGIAGSRPAIDIVVGSSQKRLYGWYFSAPS